METLKVAVLLFLAVIFTGCASTMELGSGGSMVTGAAGNNGAQGESSQLAKCDKILATVEIDESTAGAENTAWLMLASRYGMPQDTTPLLKLILSQTSCFRVVDRAIALRAAKREHELAEAGLTRKNSTVKKGQIIEAQYTLIPRVVVSQNQSSASGLGMAAGFIPIPGAGLVGGLLGGVTSKTSDAQVVIAVVNNETLVEESVAEGSAQSKDIGIGGGILAFGGGGALGSGGGAWSKTDQGKVVAAAFVDAVNKLVPTLKDLQVPSPPTPELVGKK